MGKVYKCKRRSCAMCKPHKMRWAPADTDKQREHDRVDREEIERALAITHNARGRGR